MRNDWWLTGECEYVRVLGNNAQYLNTATRVEMLISLQSLQWTQGDTIEVLATDLKSKIDKKEPVREVSFLKNIHFQFCKQMVKSLASGDLKDKDWNAKVSDWRHSLINYEPWKALDYLSHFIESNLKIINSLIWLKSNLDIIKKYHETLKFNFTTESGMYKEEWEKLLTLPTDKIIQAALSQIDKKRSIN